MRVNSRQRANFVRLLHSGGDNVSDALDFMLRDDEPAHDFEMNSAGMGAASYMTRNEDYRKRMALILAILYTSIDEAKIIMEIK